MARLRDVWTACAARVRHFHDDAEAHLLQEEAERKAEVSTPD